MPSQKKLTVLGAGGHGVESILPYLYGLQTQSVITYIPVDYGGSTGTVTRIFELEDNALNVNLHGALNHPIFPYGDINKLINKRLVDISGEAVKIEVENNQIPVLDLRSDDPRIINRALKLLSNYLRITTSQEAEFSEYINTYIEYLHIKKNQLDNSELFPTCFGNIWHTYRFYKDGGLVGVNRFYHQRGIIPNHIFIDFTYSQRQLLVGSTIADEFLTGEDKIDVTSDAVLPYTLKLADRHMQRIHSPVSNELLEQLKESDLIIIPNGSIANWLSLINSSLQIQEILRSKGRDGKLVLIANLFYNQNEFPLETYLELLADNYNIPLLVLASNKQEWDSVLTHNNSLLQAYQNQSKKPNRLESQKMRFLHDHPNLSIMHIIKLDYGQNIEGLKYDTDSVASVLKDIFPSII